PRTAARWEWLVVEMCAGRLPTRGIEDTFRDVTSVLRISCSPCGSPTVDRRRESSLPATCLSPTLSEVGEQYLFVDAIFECRTTESKTLLVACASQQMGASTRGNCPRSEPGAAMWRVAVLGGLALLLAPRFGQSRRSPSITRPASRTGARSTSLVIDPS